MTDNAAASSQEADMKMKAEDAASSANPTPKTGRKFALPKLSLPKLSLPKIGLPNWMSFERPKKAINSVGTFISSTTWNIFAEGITPDRRSYPEVSYFPLAYKNTDGSLSYFGAFVPDLLERARVDGSQTPFQAAILLPKKAYALDAEGKLSLEDLAQVGRQVEKAMAAIAIKSRNSGENLNIYNVDRMPAQGLYFDAKSGVAQSFAAAKAGDLINIYGGARKSAYHLPFIKPSKTEYALHIALNMFSQAIALIAAVGAGLAFYPVAPVAGLVAGATTLGVMLFAQQFDFWLKAEDMIMNNWVLSSKHRQAKQIDWLKLTKTLVVAAMAGYLVTMGGLEAYAAASSALLKLASLPMLQGTMLALGSKAVIAIKAFSGLLGITAAVGAFRGLMVVMHNFFGLGYAKTTVSPKERAALPVADILARNAEQDAAYKAKKNPAQPEMPVISLESSTIALQAQTISNLKASLDKTMKDLALAQNPCVSKVVAMQAVYENLVEQGEIAADLDFDSPAFDTAFLAVTAQLPMNLAAWPSAQVFNALSQAEKLKAIEAFKTSLTNKRFSEYMSAEYDQYVASARFGFDKDKFRLFMKGESYQLDQPKGDCCDEMPAAPLRNLTPDAVIAHRRKRDAERRAQAQAQAQASEPVIVITPASPVKAATPEKNVEAPKTPTTPKTPVVTTVRSTEQSQPVVTSEEPAPAAQTADSDSPIIIIDAPLPTFSPLKNAATAANTPVPSAKVGAEEGDVIDQSNNNLVVPANDEQPKAGRSRSPSREEQPTRKQPSRAAKSPRR